MFEQPAWLALAVLALPWLWWSRRRAPRDWRVGGLQPFEELPARGGAQRRVPPSAWVGLVAILLAVAGLARPRAGGASAVIVWDRSLSAGGPQLEAALQAAANEFRARQGVAVKVVEVGGPGAPAAEQELMQACRLHAAAAWLVLTDRPAPLGLPHGVVWPEFPGPAANAAILQVFPDQDGSGLWVVWEQWNREGALELVADGGDRVVLEPSDPAGGGPQRTLVQLEHGAELRLVTRDGGPPDDRPQDDVWFVPPRVSSVRLPPAAHADWDLAVEALWPGAEVVRAGEADLRVEFGTAESGPRRLVLRRDPFATGDEAAAVARVAETARALLLPPAPRARSECRPDDERATWPADVELAGTWAGRVLGRALAGLGGLLYLLAIVLRRFGA